MTPSEMARIHRAAFPGTRPWTETEIQSLLSDAGTFAIGDTACFAIVRVTLDEAELLIIATHPDHQRLGLARDVLDRCHGAARARGARRLFLEVAEDNASARALYDNCGYRASGRRPGYYRRENAPPVDALLLDRPL